MRLMFFLERNGRLGWAEPVRRECLALLVPAERGLRRLLVLMAHRIALLPPRPAPISAPSASGQARSSPALRRQSARRPAFRLTEPVGPARRPAPSRPGAPVTSTRSVPDSAVASRRIYHRLLALVEAQNAPERLAHRLARRLQSRPGPVRLAAPRLREFADVSPRETRVVFDLDAAARINPDTS